MLEYWDGSRTLLLQKTSGDYQVEMRQIPLQILGNWMSNEISDVVGGALFVALQRFCRGSCYNGFYCNFDIVILL